MEEEKEEAPPERVFPDMKLAQKAFELDGATGEVAKVELLAAIEADKMGPYYEFLCKAHGWIVDEALLASMK